MQEAASIRKKRNPRFKEVEKLRGKMCSFLLVATNMRLYIRRVTAALVENEGNELIPMTEDLKEELTVRINAH